jgi:hypothetical protein
MADANEPTGTPPEAPEPAPAGVSDPNPSAAAKGLTLANLAHGLKLVALLLFLLPWVTVSCAEQTLVSLSGVDLATGSVTVTNPMTGESTNPPGGGDADLPVLIGAILIIVALFVGFVMRRRVGALVSIASLAGAAALISYSVLYRIPAKAREDATAESAQGISSAQLAEMIRVDVATGFWLTLAALIGAIVLTFLAQREAPPGPP